MQIEMKMGITLFTSGQTDFKTKSIKKVKGHYIIIKQSIQEEYITLIKLFAPSVGTSKYTDKYQKT